MRVYEGSAHERTFSMNGLTVYFSYNTPIAFYTMNTGLVVRQNDWSNTTGGHLNAIDGGDAEAKKKRLRGEDFEVQLDAIELKLSESLRVKEVV